MMTCIFPLPQQGQIIVSAVDNFTNTVNVQPANQNLYTTRGTAYEDMGVE